MPIRKDGMIYGKRPKNKQEHDHFLFGTQTVPMSRHHLVSWGIVKRSWNRLIREGEWEILCAWIRLIFGRVQNSKWVECNCLEPMREKRFVDRDSLLKTLCWGHWNIVPGPQKRFDDPGEKFDFFHHPKELRERSIQLAALQYYLFEREDKLDLDREKIITLLESIPAKRKPIPFNEKNWEPVLQKSAGLYIVRWRKKRKHLSRLRSG